MPGKLLRQQLGTLDQKMFSYCPIFLHRNDSFHERWSLAQIVYVPHLKSRLSRPVLCLLRRSCVHSLLFDHKCAHFIHLARHLSFRPGLAKRVVLCDPLRQETGKYALFPFSRRRSADWYRVMPIAKTPNHGDPWSDEYSSKWDDK